MRKIKLTIILCALVFMILGCEKKDDTRVDGHCFLITSFFENVSWHSSDNGTYLVKGIVSDKTENYLKIKFIEDLKGNFPEKVDDFNVYGRDVNKYINGASLREDYVYLYEKQDVLIMHLANESMISNAYGTLRCSCCITKISDDYVTGFILPNDIWDFKSSLEEYMQNIEDWNLRRQQNILDTIPLDDFQKKINELLTK